MAHCPFYRGPLCSLCCGLELHCHDYCKKPVPSQAAPPAPDAAALRFRPHGLRRFGRFLGLMSVAAALLGAAFLLTYRFMDLHALSGDANLVNVMVRLYVAALVVASLGIWWMVLSHESQEQSERELLESMQHLELTRKNLVETEKLASLGGLVAGVAHEINTPVGIAVSTASYLSDRTQSVQALARSGRVDSTTLDKYLGDAAESARLLLSNATRVAQLVLNFKQLAVDRVNEARRVFDLRGCIEQALAELRPKLDEAGVEVDIDIDSPIEMQSYPVALAQIVTNLSVNSLQHAFGPGKTGGRITIRAALRDDNEVRIDYGDDGRGIDPALHSQVFEPFFTTRRMLGGSGLGLYIVNQIVTRQLDGSIALERGAEQGVRFVMHLPRMARHAPDMGRILFASPRTPRDEP